MCHAMELKQNTKLFSLYVYMLLFFTLKITHSFFRYVKLQILPDMMYLFQLQKKHRPFHFKFSGQHSIK